MVRGRRNDEDAPGRPRRSLYYYLNVLGMGDGACRRRAVAATAWTRSRSRSRDPVPASAGALQDGRPPRRAPAMSTYSLSHLRQLEAESIHIIREVAAEFENPVMLYSIGKDSSVMVRLAMKAFHPGRLPFPLLHVDTTWKFREMVAFRDAFAAAHGLKLIVHTNRSPEAQTLNPIKDGSKRWTDVMKTQALLQALTAGGFDAAFGGARRDEEKSRAKERVFSFRSAQHRWDPKNQRPELWHLYNARKRRGESIRVFPLSNWTELDVWHYIDVEQIPVVPLYFAKPREVIVRGSALQLVEQPFVPLLPDERPQLVTCRMRSLGCSPCTGAVRSEADTVPKIIEELVSVRHSERQLRVIDHDQDSSMEMKKREGYF